MAASKANVAVLIRDNRNPRRAPSVGLFTHDGAAFRGEFPVESCSMVVYYRVPPRTSQGRRRFVHVIVRGHAGESNRDEECEHLHPHWAQAAGSGEGSGPSFGSCPRAGGVNRRVVPPHNPENAGWFELHVRPHEPTLRTWLRSQFPSEDDIDDVVQESYAHLLRALECGKVTSPKAFVFAVARHLALDRVGHGQVARAEPLVESEAMYVLEEGEGIPGIIAHNQGLELLTEGDPIRS